VNQVDTPRSGYFLGQFAGKETGKDAGAFYTPRPVVRTLVEMLEPFHGRVYDPCCGSGGMFVESAKFVQAHNGNLHAARQAYADGKNYGQQRSFPIAQLRGLQVRASRWLSSDELALSLSIPSNTTTIAAKDLGGGAALGLVRRVEDLVRNTEDYRHQVQARYDLAVRRIDELAAVADSPFEHTGELIAKQSQLEQLTAQLRIEASGPEARAAAAEAQERMQAMGRKPGATASC